LALGDDGEVEVADPHPHVFLEVLIPEDLEANFTEVLIPVGLKSFRMNAMRKCLEVLILVEFKPCRINRSERKQESAEDLKLNMKFAAAERARQCEGSFSGQGGRLRFITKHSICAICFQ